MSSVTAFGKPLTAALSAALFLISPPLECRQPAGQSPFATGAAADPRSPGSKDRDLRLIHVAALQGKRQIAYGLTKQDLQFTDSKKAQVVESFARNESEPIRLAVLVDASFSETDALQPEFGPLMDPFFKDLVLKGDKAMVAVFAEEPLVLAEFTNDLSQLGDAARKAFATSPQGPGNFYDAIDWACREKLSHTAGLRVLVIFSNAIDTNSIHNFDQVQETLQRTDTLVYFVQPYVLGGGFGRVDVANWLANETGGFAYTAFDSRGFTRDLERIAIVVSNLYTLAYLPTGVARDGKFHAIQVKSKRHGVNLYTRDGYYAPPE